MRRFTVDTAVRAAAAQIAANTARGERPGDPVTNHERVVNAVRRALDKSIGPNGRTAAPLDLDEWAELAAILAAQLVGARADNRVHQDIDLAWSRIVSKVRDEAGSIEAKRRASYEQDAADGTGPPTDPYGTAELDLGIDR